MRTDWYELFVVVVGAIANGLFWLLLLPMPAGAILATITSTGFALAMAGWFNHLEIRRDTLSVTSHQQEAHNE